MVREGKARERWQNWERGLLYTRGSLGLCLPDGVRGDHAESGKTNPNRKFTVLAL